MISAIRGFQCGTESVFDNCLNWRVEVNPIAEQSDFNTADPSLLADHPPRTSALDVISIGFQYRYRYLLVQSVDGQNRGRYGAYAPFCSLDGSAFVYCNIATTIVEGKKACFGR